MITTINHIEYPKTLKTKSVDSLRYIIGDCKNAIEAMPNGHKAGYYADEIHYCAMELRSRTNVKTLVDAVKAHALKNYERGGWDYIIECWDDDDIAEEIGKATTEGGAIRKVGKVANRLGERRAEVQAEIF
jgi:hypothetical protein